MNRVQSKFICDALEAEYFLSESESRFINDLAEMPEDYVLTERQNQWLNKIITNLQDRNLI